MRLFALQTVLALGEPLPLDLKSTREKDDACRALRALANGRGRQLVFGVAPAGKVVGQNMTARPLKQLAQLVWRSESPLCPYAPSPKECGAGREAAGKQAKLLAAMGFKGRPY